MENGIGYLGLPMVDMFTGTIATNKTDGLNRGMVTYSVHRGTASMDNIENTRRKAYSNWSDRGVTELITKMTCTLTQLRYYHGCARIAF